MHHKSMTIVYHVSSFCSLLLALFKNQGIIISMITPSMKLSQLEMALGMETLAPGLHFAFWLIAKYYKVFNFRKSDGGCGCIYTRLPYCTSNFWMDYSYINFLSPYILPCIFSYALINKSNKVLIGIVLFFIMYLCAKQDKLSLLAYPCILGSLFRYMSQIK